MKINTRYYLVSAIITMSDYSNKNIKELIALCKAKGIKGYSTKKKAELIELLLGIPTTSNTTIVTDKTATVTKPFLKWVGGKTQILDNVLELFPKKITNYHEPFLGGGSVLLGLLSYMNAGTITVSGKIYASDLNSNIIHLYKNVQTNPQGLIDEVKILSNEYTSITGTEVNRAAQDKEDAMKSQESYYYWIRSKFNALKDKSSVIASAMLLFMNKTCFRGVYREGPKGFNVPFGNYNHPTILDEEHIRHISELIKDVVFTTQPFQDSLNNVVEDDFVYLDPPYAPETEKSFVGYTADGFDLDSHNKLFELAQNMTGNGVKWVMSNASVKLVKDAFNTHTYTTKIIEARRAINSKNPEAKTNEVLIKN